MWPDRRLIDRFKTEFPIVLAPMAGVMDAELVIAVAQGGGLGSLPCAMLSAEKAREQVNIIRQRVCAPVNLNFFCHKAVDADPAREAAWRQRLGPYYREHGLDPDAPINAANRAPFDAAFCAVVEELKPEVVSFHFGLPEPKLLQRVKAAGAIVMSSATTVKEAIWLEENGADVVIAQGADAGGHRAMFLTNDIAEQPGTFSLLPQVVDAVKVPVVAAGGIADGRGIAAAFALGASGVQIGTAFLRCPESKVSAQGRVALAQASDESTVITNVMTGLICAAKSGETVRGVVMDWSRKLQWPAPFTARSLANDHLRRWSGHEIELMQRADEIAVEYAAARAAGNFDIAAVFAGESVGLIHDIVPAAEIVGRIVAEAEQSLQGRRNFFPSPLVGEGGADKVRAG